MISRPWSRDSSSFCPGLGLETWWPRSRSWSQDSMLGAYACSTITVICSTFKRVLCHQLELMQPVLWSRDHGLEWDHGLECTRVHFVQVSVSRPEVQGLGLGLETWWLRSWSRELKKVLTTTLPVWNRSGRHCQYCNRRGYDSMVVLWKDDKRVKKCMDYVFCLCSSHICVT